MSPLCLASIREALAPYGVLVGCRRIGAGDEDAFADCSAGAASIERRRASGAARIAARRLLQELGSDGFAPLTRLAGGLPEWPKEVLGSLAHDEVYAVAAVGWRGRLVGLGVDIEPAEPLPEDLLDLVLRPPEQSETEGDGVARRLVFAAKEAVFKAVYPLNRTAFEYPDVEVRLREKTATLRDGRRLALVMLRADWLVAVALAFAAS